MIVYMYVVLDGMSAVPVAGFLRRSDALEYARQWNCEPTLRCIEVEPDIATSPDEIKEKAK